MFLLLFMLIRVILILLTNDNKRISVFGKIVLFNSGMSHLALATMQLTREILFWFCRQNCTFVCFLSGQRSQGLLLQCTSFKIRVQLLKLSLSPNSSRKSLLACPRHVMTLKIKTQVILKNSFWGWGSICSSQVQFPCLSS